MVDVIKFREIMLDLIKEMGYKPMNIKIKSFNKNDNDVYDIKGVFEEINPGIGTFMDVIEFNAKFNEASGTFDSFVPAKQDLRIR